MDNEFEINLNNAKRIAIKLLELSTKKIEVLDISKKNKGISFLVLASAVSEEVAKVISLDMQTFLKELKIPLFNIDGAFRGEWIVMDCGRIVIHIFTEHSRNKYNLEKLWKDSKNVVKWVD